MQCLNSFLIGAANPTSINSSQNSPSFVPRVRAQNLFHRTEAYDDVDSKILPKKAVSLPSNVNIITSTSNPFVKHCVKLRQSSSYRHSHGSVLVVGTTPIREIYSFDKTLLDTPTLECLFTLENSHIPEEINKSGARVVHVSPEVIRKISGVLSAESVDAIALLKIPSTFHTASNNLHQEVCHALFSFPRRILVLDGIQDPGNLGTLIRSAKAFGWDGVFLLPGCCDPFNDKALRACRGACFQIPIVSGDWTHIETIIQEFEMKMFAGHPATGDGPNPVMKLSKDFVDSVADLPLCLVLGSEGAGLSERSRKACQLVTIPMAGEFESLNVSVAGGIFMYAFQEEKRKPV